MKYGLVLIDDTGTPSHQAGSSYLDSARSTWVGVVADPRQSLEIREQLPEFLKEFQVTTGLAELHCADLFSGKGCRAVPFDVRLAILGALADIFRQERFLAFTQTVDNRTMADLRLRGIRFPDVIGPFRMSDRQWMSLFMLLIRIRRHLLELDEESRYTATFHVDEGLRRRGEVVATHLLQKVSPDDALHFESSLDFPPLQLADFAAFCMNRMQWTLTKSELTDRDEQLLRVLEPLQDSFVNLNLIEFNLSEWTASSYERIIDRDRLDKGLPPTPEMEI